MSNQRIVIQRHGGLAAGPPSLEFSSSVIRIGRGPGNDVTFDPYKDRVVSSRHAEIRWTREGPVLVDLDSSNGTFLDGQPIRRPTALMAGQRIQLGRHGPKLLVKEVTGAPEAAAAPMDRSGPSGPVGNSCRGIGMNTMLRVVEHTARRERKKMAVVGACAALVVLVSTLVAWRMNAARSDELARSQARLVDEQAKLAADADRLKTLDHMLRPSVYLMVRQRRAKGRWVDSQGFGTAWQVNGTQLATNAHVAKICDDLQADERVIGRVHRGERIVEVAIVGFRLHPGYRKLNELAARIRPFVPGTGLMDFPPAWDVALLDIAPDDTDKLIAPLELADDDTLQTLQGGQPLCFLGFPLETVIGGGTDIARPVATFRDGRLSKIQDFFMGPGTPETTHLLTITAAASGGASGSPIVDVQGKVVGLLNSGDVVMATARGRLSGDNTYVMRADVLRELMNGDAENRQDKRVERWTRDLMKRWEEGRKAFLDSRRCLREFQAILAKELPGKTIEFERVDRREVQLSGAGPKKGKVISYEGVRPGIYVALAVSSTHPKRIGLFSLKKNGLPPDPTISQPETWFATHLIVVERVLPLVVSIFAGEQEKETGGGVEFMLFRANISD